MESDLIAPVLSYPDGTLVVTAKDYSGLFRVLYNATYLDRDRSEEALGLLARSSFDRGIAAGVPPGTVVANKYGYGGNPGDPSDHQFHDCGIVYGGEGPYILCVFTKTTGMLPPHEIIAAVSRDVYDHLHASDLALLPEPPGKARPH
jgi:beta-lactamase class A